MGLSKSSFVTKYHINNAIRVLSSKIPDKSSLSTHCGTTTSTNVFRLAVPAKFTPGKKFIHKSDDFPFFLVYLQSFIECCHSLIIWKFGLKDFEESL